IDVQYYLWHQDETGRLLAHRLLAAADRGVRVRILVDDMAVDGGDASALALDAHPSIEVRIFNPFDRRSPRTLQYVTRFGVVTRRMHNKSFTVDNRATILGGRNIGDEYFDTDPSVNFQDLDVLGIGQIAPAVSAAFDAYWNHELAWPVSALVEKLPTAEAVAQARAALNDYIDGNLKSPYLQRLNKQTLLHRFRDGSVRFTWADWQLLVDDPDKLRFSRSRKDLRLSEQLMPHLDAIEHRLLIVSPYFVPGVYGSNWLISLAKRGVRVRVLTNAQSSTDVGIVHAGYQRYRKRLLRGGVELYEVNRRLSKEQRAARRHIGDSSKSSLHAKVFVLDGEAVFIGSLNLDPRSVVENSEIGVLVQSPELARQIERWFDANQPELAFRLKLDSHNHLRWYGRKGGQPVVLDREPYVKWWQALGVDLMSWLPIESQL
ncbi:unnamed protein product, partial [Cyprideis torosa]